MRRLFVLLMAGLTANVTAELPTWTTLAERARWAANAHNVQSWRLDPVAGRPDQRRLGLNPDRLLPQTDPWNRQLTISLGAFLAVLQEEAAVRGARIHWTPLEDGLAGALVTLEEGQARAPDPGIADALTAPTVKYRTAALSLPPAVRTGQEAQSTPTVSIRWVSDPTEVAAAKVWAQGAYDLEMDLPRTRDESRLYTQIGERARQARPYGITLLANFPKGELFWIEGLAGIFPQSPTDYSRSAKDLLAQALDPVEQIVVVTSKGNGVRERLETGEALQRLWLDVRSRGGELLPLSQGLQEFPEMTPYYDQAHRIWARPGETVQMVLALFRPGPGEFLPSPRLPAEAVVR